MGTSVFPWTGMRQASVTLTNAQTKALPTTAVQLVAAPGANKVLVPLFAWWQVTWAQDYANIGDEGRIGIEYGTSLKSPLAAFHEAALSQVSDLLADGASHQTLMVGRLIVSDIVGLPTGSSLGQGSDDPEPINAALSIYAVNSGSHTGDFTGGDAGNSIRVTVIYLIYDMTLGQFV